MTNAEFENRKKKTYRIQRRMGPFLYAVIYSFCCFRFLWLAVLQWREFSNLIAHPWWDTWWINGLFAITWGWLAIEKWHGLFFARIVIDEFGISYHGFFNKKQAAWEQVERVAVLQRRDDTSCDVGLVLKESETSGSRKRSLWQKTMRKWEIPLTPFVDEWLYSDLRNEIKRSRPDLPMM